MQKYFNLQLSFALLLNNNRTQRVHLRYGKLSKVVSQIVFILPGFQVILVLQSFLSGRTFITRF